MLELILEKSFDSIAIQEITDRADLGRGTFYFHFKNKEDAIWSIVEDRIHATEKKLAQGFDGLMPEKPEYYGYLKYLWPCTTKQGDLSDVGQQQGFTGSCQPRQAVHG